MKHIFYAIPAMALLSLALVTASAPARQDPRGAGSALRMAQPGYHDGAQDSCVQQWDELLALFDRGDTELIRWHLCNQGSATRADRRTGNAKNRDDQDDPSRRNAQEPDPSSTSRSTTSAKQEADGSNVCIARSAIAFLGAGEGDGTTSVTGADSIVARLCAIWPPLAAAQADGAHRSRIVKSLVLAEGQDHKIYLLTIERPPTKSNAQKSVFFVSALVGHQNLGSTDGSGLRSGEAAANREKASADRSGPNGESSASSMPRNSGRILHLHVSMAR